MRVGRRQAVVLVILAAIPAVIAAQLNPTVKVLPRPKTAVPAECDQGLAIQPALRLTPEERTSVRDTNRDMVAPPSRSLRGELQTAFDAAQHNSRDAFRDALVQSKSMLNSYPPGGERTAASNLVEVLDDVDKIWDYQFTSPTGAFFDTSSEPYRIATKYSGYEAAIRRQIVTDQNGVKFYPTHETRDFLLAESAQRLSHLTGKPVPPPVVSTRGTTTIVRTAPHVTPPVTTTTAEKTPKPKPHHTTKQTTKEMTTETTSHATTHVKRPSQHRAPRHPVVREARATTPVVREARTTTPTPRATKPTPAPVAATPKPTPIASTPITTTRSATTETATAKPTPPPTTSSASTASSDTAMTMPPSTTSAPSSTETTATTATTETNGAAKPAQSRSLFGPILLIIIGIGLLLTLWRASS